MHLYAHSHQHSWHLSLLGLNALGGAAPTLFSFVSLSVGSGTKGHTGCCSEKKWNLRPPSRDHQDCEWRWLPFIIDIYIWVCANVDVVERERERGVQSGLKSLQIICVWLLANVSVIIRFVFYYLFFSLLQLFESLFPTIICMMHHWSF